MKHIYLKLFAVVFAAMVCMDALAEGLSFTAGGTSSYLLPSNFTVDGTTVTSSDNPFTGGTLVKGTNVKAFSVNKSTAQGVAAFATPYVLTDGEEVTISFVAYQGWLNDKNQTSTIAITNSADSEIFSYTYKPNACNVISVKIGGVELCTTEFKGQSKADGGKGGNAFTHGTQAYSTSKNNNTVVTVTIKKTGYVSANFKNVAYEIDKTFTGSLDEGTAVDFNKILFTSTITAGNEIGITDLTLTSTVKAATPVTYTIKYTDGGGNLIIEVTKNTYVGESYTASATDMQPFESEDGLKKYTYNKGNESKTAVEKAANNVITLVYDTYEKTDYTVIAKAGGVEKGTASSGQAFLDGSYTAYISKFLKGRDGKWYKTTGTSYGVKISEATTEVNYAEADIDYFFEVEELTNNIGKTSGDYSNGGYSAIAGGKTASLGTLPAGKYTATAYLVERGDRAIVYRYNGGEASAPVNKNSAKNEYSVDFTLTAETEVSLGGYTTDNGSTNQSAGIDYIYIKKTGEAISLPYEYNTYRAANDLDFTDNTAVAAYKAQMNNENTAVMLKQVDKVKAGEGVILKRLGTDETAVVNLTTGAEALADNQLKGVAEDMDATALVADNAYILVNQKFQKVGANATGVLPAGKAYLSLPAETPASVLRMIIVGEPTGVTDVEEAVLPTENIIYNMQGMRVKNPVKGGLYIVNGKTYMY